LYTPDPGYPNIVAAEALHHFCAIEIAGGFLSFAAISADGDTLDRFVLTDPLVDVGSGPETGAYLCQNVPNPFAGSTKIAFTLGENAHVRLRVFDAAGRLVRTLIDDVRRADRYVEVWDGVDGEGRRVPSGMYFYELDLPGREAVRKMLLVR
jgi:hypothetical protein